MKMQTLSSSYIIFPVSFLVLFQLFVACISVTPIGFLPNIFISIIASATVSRSITNTFKTDIHFKTIELSIVVILSAVSTYLFVLSLNREIFDFTCATGLLGSVTQVTEGRFPVSYLSFPDIPMNYHQSTILMVGIFVSVLKIPVAAALKIFLATLFFFLNIVVSFLFLQKRNGFYFLPILLFIAVASISGNLYSFLGLGAMPSVSVFRFSNSNSWPLALLLITTLLFTLFRFNNSKKHIFLVGLLILSMATINAVAFQFLILGLFLSLVVYYFYKWRTGTLHEIQHPATTFTTLTLITLIPKFIPSAFAIGTLYASPEIEIRFLAFTFSAYIKDILQYITLTGFLPTLTLIICAPAILKRAHPIKTALYTLLVVSFFFPFVFSFNDLYEWHALHKIAVFCLFISILLITDELHSSKKKRLISGIAIMLAALTSTQSIYIHTHELVSMDFNSFNYPDPGIKDVVTHLSSHRTTLIPYKIKYRHENIFCDMTRYAQIAQYSGNFLRDAYDTTFLLDPELETQYEKDASWNNFAEKSARVRTELDAGATLIVDKSLLTPESRKELENHIPGTPMEFSEYILYRTKPW